MSWFSKEDSGGTKIRDLDTITIKTNLIILLLEGKRKRDKRNNRTGIS